ncbi:MAG: hypothetical protein IPM48_06215 [Saprospiraceae bacterium]|nr:hypothetical protein [Saprospiraceae bacterium]
MNKIILLVSLALCWVNLQARQPAQTKSPAKSKQLSSRSNCSPATKQIDQDINNVRARLLNGGDVWWDLQRGRYVVPKVVPGSGRPEVSSIFAGAVWVGGYDPAGALKLMAQTYRSPTRNDCWPGPLTELGETNAAECIKWDQFFRVYGADITLLISRWNQAKREGRTELTEAEIPEDVLYWPAKGNPFFERRYNFALPDARQGLALFYEENDNKIYEPHLGEYPVIDIRDCPKDIYPDEMIFWIYNDAGGIHTNSNGDPIRMEVQVQAFGFRTADELNDMTFQRYKLINRAPQEIRDCYFAMWIDPDLGCFSDDYIGCDTTFVKMRPKRSDTSQLYAVYRDLMYIYNIDATDGSNGCNCEQNVNTYCNNIPILGVDYFRGPLDEFGDEIGMSYFMYYNGRGLGGSNPAATEDPTSALEFYQYLTGRWRDGSPLVNGGIGYIPGGGGTITRYAFPGAPNDGQGWSMCTGNAGEGDRRTLQVSGPLRLDPGAVNELIIGIPWVPDQTYPCPGLDELLKADQLCQDLFDNCFDIKDGPTAPDVDFVELDKEIVFLLSNDPGSNNFNLGYSEKGLGIPPGYDSLYRFEGYRIYQVSGPDVSLSDRTIADPSLVRELVNFDLKNKVKILYDWIGIKNPNPSTTHPVVYYPVEKVSGLDQGVRHSFSAKEDLFATGLDNSLINHKKYYYIIVAYAYNNYQDYDVQNNFGQRMQYCLGRLNVGATGDGKPYVVTPRPQIYEKVNSAYGEGIPVTRVDGAGIGGNFVRLQENVYDRIITGGFDGKIDYIGGSAPIEVKIVNPLKVKDGEYEIRFVDADPNNNRLDPPINWTLKNLADPSKVIQSTGPINRFNEQIISSLGISVAMVQTEYSDRDTRGTNGIVAGGLEAAYKNPNGVKWFIAQADFPIVGVDFIKTALGSPQHELDPLEQYSKLGKDEYRGFWYPYKLCVDTMPLTPVITNPANRTPSGQMRLDSLNNVDIVFTSDKSKWSRCVVVESWNENNLDFGASGPEPNTGNDNFSLKTKASVGKYDRDGDGYADPDGELDASGRPLTGMGWFPGYAVDVETGRRLNIFFGENTYYSDINPLVTPCILNENIIGNDTLNLSNIGNDLMWNPTDQVFLEPSCGFTPGLSVLSLLFGGHHYIYVTKSTYDSCRTLRTFLANNTNPGKRTGTALITRGIRDFITWTTMPLMAPGTKLDNLGSGETGLIPNEYKVSLRVDKPFIYSVGTNENNGHNMYTFKIDGKEAGLVASKEDFENALDNVNVVPNPYYGFSSYESGQFSNTVKISNLPPKCKVTIYSIDGKFIKEYNRDEKPIRIVSEFRGATERQIGPDIEWDLTNFRGIPVSSGAYLIYIKETDTGAEKIVKWFGVARKFDPSGL